MSAPPFRLVYTDEAQAVMTDLQQPRHTAKHKKVVKTLRLLRDVGLAHPGLNSHKYHSMAGPGGEDVWESYVENRRPGAWRIWWMYGPGSDAVAVITIGPHP